MSDNQIKAGHNANLHRLLQVVASLLLLASFTFWPAAQPQPLKLAISIVTKVIDGDTFEVSHVSGGEGLPSSIRAYLVNAPKTGECFRAEATKGALELLLGRTVWLKHQGRVISNQLLAFVYLDSDQQALFQAIMLSQGLTKANVCLLYTSDAADE
mgnify:CR=1 FL=1